MFVEITVYNFNPTQKKKNRSRIRREKEELKLNNNNKNGKKIVKKTYSCGIIWLRINIHSSASFSMEWVWKVAFCLNIRPSTNTNTLLSKQHITSYYHMPLQRWIYEPNTLHLIAIKNSNMPNCWLLASYMTFPKSRFEIQYCV